VVPPSSAGRHTFFLSHDSDIPIGSPLSLDCRSSIPTFLFLSNYAAPFRRFHLCLPGLFPFPFLIYSLLFSFFFYISLLIQTRTPLKNCIFSDLLFLWTLSLFEGFTFSPSVHFFPVLCLEFHSGAAGVRGFPFLKGFLFFFSCHSLHTPPLPPSRASDSFPQVIFFLPVVVTPMNSGRTLWG